MPVSAGIIVPHPPLIVPEVGRGQQRDVEKTSASYHEAAKTVGALSPQTVIIVSPHSVMYSDYIHISPGAGASGDMRQFGASTVYSVRYDEPFVAEISRLCSERKFPAGTLGEHNPSLDHGCLVPLHFIDRYLEDFTVVRCSISGLPTREHYSFGMILREAAENLGRDTVIVASGDLSHKLKGDGPYGFAPEGPELDRRITDVMKSGDFGGFFAIDEALSAKGADCGLRAFIVMAGALDRRSVNTRFYSYEGPFGVGYAVGTFLDAGEDASRAYLDAEIKNEAMRVRAARDTEDAYVKLARAALEGYVGAGEPPPLPEELPDELHNERAGVFVSIKKRGELRGCIGTTGPTRKSVAEEIRANAISSGTGDPRFDAVTEDELPELIYSVDVLSPPEPCVRDALDPARYGVIVTAGRKRGLLLPNLDGVDTIDEQIDIARRKAGISGGERYTLERFEVVRHT